MQAAVTAGAAPDLRRLAHSAAGASGTCGVRRLCALLRQLEAQAAEQQLAHAPELARDIAAEFQAVRSFLENYLASSPEPIAKA